MAAVYDANGNARTGFGMSYDLTTNAGAYAIDARWDRRKGYGSISSGFDGYYANDASSPASRQFGGNSNSTDDSAVASFDTTA